MSPSDARRDPGPAASGRGLVTLTNGSKEVSERLFTDAGIRAQFDTLMPVEDSGAWKPAHASHEHAVRTCDTEPADLLLVAVHP